MAGFLLLFTVGSVASGGIMLAAGEQPKVVVYIVAATFIPAFALFAVIFPHVLVGS